MERRGFFAAIAAGVTATCLPISVITRPAQELGFLRGLGTRSLGYGRLIPGKLMYIMPLESLYEDAGRAITFPPSDIY